MYIHNVVVFIHTKCLSAHLVFFSAHNNNLTTYEVQYREVDSPNDVNDTFYGTVTVPAGMTQSYTISGLMAYSAYNVSVRATNQYGVGELSEEVTVRTEEGGLCVLHLVYITANAASCSH